MRITLFLFSMLLFLNSCDSKEEELEVLDLTVKNIAGTWQLTETYISPGGHTEWKAVEDGPVFQINEEGTYTYSDLNCDSGSYELNGAALKLMPNCEEEQEITFLLMELSENVMVLRNAACIEACNYKYLRI